MTCSSKKHRQFIYIFLLIVCFTLLFSTLFNFVVDPFSIYQPPPVDQVDVLKPNLREHDRLHQAIQIAKNKPKALIFGSSRVLKINPQDFAEREVYNAGLRGARFDEIFHYFEHALYHQPHLEWVLIGLDFFAFNQNIKDVPDFKLGRLKNQEFTWQDFSASLLSWDALKCSLETFIANCFPYLISPKEAFIWKGHVAYLKKMLKEDYKHYEIDLKKIEMFQKIVKICQERSINLTFFFNPTHALYWETLYRSHLWPKFEDLKRQLSAIYPIWDFSGFNSVTMQTCAQPFYQECSHYTPLVGKMMGQKMFQQLHSFADFGYLLTPLTLEHDLEQMRQQARKWMESHENIMEQIEHAIDW